MRTPASPRGIPILLYHGLWSQSRDLEGRSAAELQYWVSAETFATHMQQLAAHGYTAVPLATLLAEKQPPLPAKPFVLTFDDGWASDWHIATPLLAALGWRAELFVTIAHVDTPGFMTWEQVRQAAAAGMGIQSHSLNHRDLSTLPLLQLRCEIAVSKWILEHHTAQAVDFFALPYGTGVLPRVQAEAQAAGYRGLCTSEVGLNPAGANPFCFRRIVVTRTTSYATLENWLCGKGLSTLALRRQLLRSARRCVGARVYEWLKARLLRPLANQRSLHG